MPWRVIVLIGERIVPSGDEKVLWSYLSPTCTSVCISRGSGSVPVRDRAEMEAGREETPNFFPRKRHHNVIQRGASIGERYDRMRPPAR